MNLFNFRNIFYTITAVLFNLPLAAHEPIAEEVFRRNMQELRQSLEKQCPDILDFSKMTPLTAASDTIQTQIAAKQKQLLPYLTRPFAIVKIMEDGQLVTTDEERFLYNLMEQLDAVVPYRGEPNLHFTFRPMATGNWQRKLFSIWNFR